MLPRIAPARGRVQSGHADPSSSLSSRHAPASVLGVLLAHRVCAPEHARFVEAACLRDRRVLPRWQQDDRGPNNATRGFHRQANPGAYTLIRPWNGRADWLAFTVPVALKLHAELLHGVVSEALMRRYLTVASGYAQDQRTGRRCIVRPDTIASVLGVTKRAVQICRRLARIIGLEVVVQWGRMLTREEVFACRRHGSTQRGLSTEVAFTIPAVVGRRLGIFTPTRGPSPSHPPHLINHYLRAARETKDAAPRRQHPPRGPACPAGRRLAGQLLDLIRLQRHSPTHDTPHTGPSSATATAAGRPPRLPWLTREHPARIAPLLHPFAQAGWTAADILLKLDEVATRRGLTIHQLTPDQIRTHPAALLANLMRDLHPDADHPNPPDLHPTPLPACTRDDCDHGWITLPNGRAAKCPTCPPSTRTHTWHDDDTTDTDTWDPNNPPF